MKVRSNASGMQDSQQVVMANNEAVDKLVETNNSAEKIQEESCVVKPVGVQEVDHILSQRDDSVSPSEGTRAEEEKEVTADGFVPYEEVEVEALIPEADMEWLIRSGVILVKASSSLQNIVSIIEGLRANIQVRCISSVMLLITVEKEGQLEECINMVKNVCEEWIIEIAQWELFNSQPHSLVWIKLEEVPLELWHENFFFALGGSWGEVVKLDECTLNRSSFKQARMQILVTSLSCIPQVVVGSSFGTKFRICVSIEAEDMVVTTGKLKSPSENHNQLQFKECIGFGIEQ
ncbi:hypothetical protein COLO4_19561 [Corchorus olitorius]|uniref:Uncharacterized protein n=1 Tax=Corchorus olitorius TaxID=93759 RepID=A0A1R3J4W2_9ROSI|nr:hypothetical protein COLO4_19561 [Corchorus olitorius]